jgi:hypothetical protein
MELFEIGKRYELVTSGDESVSQIPTHVVDFIPTVYIGKPKNYFEFAQKLDDSEVLVYGLTDLITNGGRVMARSNSDTDVTIYSTTQQFGGFGFTAQECRIKAKNLLDILSRAGL